MALVCRTVSQPPRACPGAAKATPSASATVARPGSVSTRVTSRPGNRASSLAMQQPDHPRPDHGDPVADQGRGVPQRVHRRLHGAGEDGPGHGDVVRHRGDRPGGHDVRRLVRVEAEDGAPAQVLRPVLDDPHVEVAVLHRPGEGAVLERRPHRVVLAGRDPPVEDQGLGPPADRRPQGPDEHVVGTRHRQGHRADLPETRLPDPEGPSVPRHRTTSTPSGLTGPLGEPEQRLRRT